MNKPMPPCKDCKRRGPECHSHCREYLDFVERNKEYKAENDMAEVKDYIWDRMLEREKRNRRR